MSTIIKGLLSQNLPWGLVLVGVFISITLELCGIHSLSFAVGVVPADCDDGADLRRRAGARRTSNARPACGRSRKSAPERCSARGSSPAVALRGFSTRSCSATTSFREADAGALAPIPFLHDGTSGMIAGALLFAGLGVVVARAAQKKICLTDAAPGRR